MHELSRSARYLLTGFALLKRPELRLFVAIPLLLNVLVFAGLGYVAIGSFGGWLDGLMQSIPDWAQFVRYLLWPLFVILLLVLYAYTFTVVGTIIVSPVAGILAEKTEELLRGRPAAVPFRWANLPLIAARSLRREGIKLLYYLGWIVIMVIVSLMLSPVAPFAWFLFGAWMMAVQYIDYPMDNNQLSFAQLKQWLGKHRMSALGFGAAVMVASMLPLVNLVVIPAAICGATALWLDKEKHC